MSRNTSAQELSFTYRYLISNCEPKTVTASRVVGLLDKARDYLAAFEGGACETDAMKFRVIYVGSGLQRAEDYCPSNLQYAQIALGERPSSKVESRYGKLIAGQAAQVIG